ncbi:MAG: hypothetical protein V7647_2446 [Acidobacteriota bacterium]|jgi:hypothetical protein
MFLASRTAALLVSWSIACIGGPPASAAARDRAQAPANASPAARAASTASISGHVLSGADGAPLARARVTLVSPALTDPRVALSRAGGEYDFVHLPAGSYTITASRSGYASRGYSDRPSARTTAVTLAEGQALNKLDVVLPAAGVIVGRILDEDGKPFSGATVDALVSRTDAGQATLASVSTTESDDRGEFRLSGLPAGQYYLSAFDPAFARVGDETGPLRYNATYYPGVASVEEATRITVVPGLEPAPVSLGLKIVRPGRVSGRLNTPERRQLLSAAVVMTHMDTALSEAADQANVLPNGTFTFRNVPPGRYEIRARGDVTPGGTALFASFRLRLEGRDVTDIVMELLPGATLSGELTFEPAGARHPPFTGFRVRAPLIDGRSFADALTGGVTPEGTYAIRGVMPGRHVLAVEGLPYPWVMKSVTWAGQDVTDAGLEADARQRFDNIRITLTDLATDVSGVVHDENGKPVPDAMVLMIPQGQQYWQRTSRRFGLLRTGADGRFRIRGLPDGEYRAVAPVDLDESDAFRTAVLDELMEAGAPISLKPLEQRVLDLPLTQPGRVRRASSR